MGDLVQDLSQAALSELDYFGIAPVERFSGAPPGHRPEDFLPSARSVISMGIRIPEGAIAANRAAYAGKRPGIFAYMVFGYVALNENLTSVALRVARRLERQGYFSTPVPPGNPRDAVTYMGMMSNRHAAVCAGLAHFGWNGLAMTEDSGPRVRWVSVVTEAELPANPLLEGPSPCDREECGACISACPVKAINSDEYVELTIGGRKFSYGLLDKMKCRAAVAGLARGTVGRAQLEVPENLDPRSWLQFEAKDDPWNKAERVASMCGRCLVVCPAGRRA